MAEDKAPAKGRPPDYTLNCLHRTTELRGKVGAAWKNDDGSIRVVIDPFIVLPPGREIVLTLFKADSYTPKPKPAGNQPRTAADAVDDLDKANSSREPGDEVPF